MRTTVHVYPKTTHYPRLLVRIENESGTYRVVETKQGLRGEGHFIIERQEEEPDALGDFDWEPVTDAGFALLGPVAREYYNQLHY